MRLSLRKPMPADEASFRAMHEEFVSSGEYVYPGILRSFGGDYTAFLKRIEDMSCEQRVPDGHVPSDSYVLADETGALYGMCAIRRRLNDELLEHAGHICYGIRPFARQKGLGTVQLMLALEKARALGIERALVTCAHENTASARVIENNGGVYEDERADPDGGTVKRYWISLSREPVCIRRAQNGDEAAIRVLQEEIALLHYEGRPDLFKSEARYFTAESFHKRLDDPDHYIWIALNASGEAVGYTFANIVRYRNHSTYRNFDSFYVDDICVLSAYRRMGIGSRLFEKCTRQAKLLHCINVELGVWGFNEGAIRFYEHMGMHERVRRMELRLEESSL